MSGREKAKIMDEETVERVIARIVHEILEKTPGTESLVIVGIKSRGEILANRIAKKIQSIEGKKVPVGAVDITLYRDDWNSIGPKPIVHQTEMPFDVTNKIVVLVDDVLFTGRTVRAAIDEIIDFGRPKYIRLAVLVDRGHRELPIRADYVGKTIPTSKRELVSVHLKEKDGTDEVFIEEKET